MRRWIRAVFCQKRGKGRWSHPILATKQVTSGEISPPVVDDPVPSSSTQQSCKCQCSEMKEQLEDLQKKVEFLLKEIKKPSSPKSVPARRPPGSTHKGKHAKKNSLTLNICGNYSFTFTLLT